MPTQLTAEDAKQSLAAHVAAKGAEIYQKYGPTIRWQFGKQLASARQRHHTFEICHLAAFDFSILLLVIGVGEIIPHRGQTWPAVRPGNDFFRVKSVLNRPLPPDPCHGWSGIN